MKSRILLYALAAMLQLSAAAQRYEPLTTWSYVYPEFASGSVTVLQGGTVEYDKLNVNLVNGKCNFVKDGVVMEMSTASIVRLNIGEDTYVPASGVLVKLLKRTDKGGAVVEKIEVDVEAMNKTDIGYGKSSLASTQNVSLVALAAEMSVSVNRSLDDVAAKRSEGDALALRTTKGFVFNGGFVPATRYDILNIPGIDKNAVKDFLKKSKIKLKNIDDIGRLVDFLSSL